MFDEPFWVVSLFCISGVALAFVYFRSYRLSRPPIGVFNLKDIATMLVFIIAAPFLYLWLPAWLAAGLLVLAASSIFYFFWEPVLPTRVVTWLVVSILLALDTLTSLLSGPGNNLFLLVNNFILVIIGAGLTNLWVQSGMKARDAAIFGLLLAVYDYLATSLFTLTGDMFSRLAGLPFSPVIEWQSGDHHLSIGLGDLLLTAVFPLVMLKGYGWLPGLNAALLSLVIIEGLLALPQKGYFPVMVILGPIMFGQYLLWARWYGKERKLWQYNQEEKAFLVKLKIKHSTLPGDKKPLGRAKA